MTVLQKKVLKIGAKFKILFLKVLLLKLNRRKIDDEGIFDNLHV